MKNKYILLTGGTGGLGISVTRAVLAAGAKSVTLPYLHESSLELLKSQLSTAEMERLRCLQANLNDEPAVERIVQGMGQVDVLIHLVGGFQVGRIDEFSCRDWQAMLDLNLNTTFLACKHALGRMRQTGYGRIVAVGSRGAEQPGAQLGAYCASKAGVVALIQAIAQETKDRNTDITANVVLPSIIDTPKNREAMGNEQAWAWVKAESLAEVICFLASEAARDIRGAAIPVYGKA
jgi:NAD(P)-dependent dehydrogenase (short-subunit alcohol dehydrogenase family)